MCVQERNFDFLSFVLQARRGKRRGEERSVCFDEERALFMNMYKAEAT